MTVKSEHRDSELFLLHFAHGDGAVAVMGKSSRVAFLAAISMGKIENENLRIFVADMRRAFPWIQLIGQSLSRPPWYAVGAFSASNRLRQIEIDDLDAKLDELMENLKTSSGSRDEIIPIVWILNAP